MTARVPFVIDGAPLSDMAISGAVKNEANAALAGVTMTLSGAASKTTVSDASGNYSFAALADGVYTVTPSLAGSKFTPESKEVTINAASMTAQDFVGRADTVLAAVSGTLAAGGSPLAGVTVSLTGAAAGTAVTDASGNFSFPGLASGNYTITPSLAGFTFTPTHQDLALSGANVSGNDFAGAASLLTSAISGTLTGAGGAPLAGVTMTLTGAGTRDAVTDASGNFSFTGLANGSYLITPIQAGFIFTPTSLSVTVSGANVGGKDFVAAQAAATDPTSVITGTLTNQAGARLAGVTVTLSGTSIRGMAAVTDGDGHFTFTGLPAGQYTLTPTQSGVTFTPPSLIINVTAGSANSGQDFSGVQAVANLSIAGTIANQSGAPLSGASVALGGDASMTAVTDASGVYSFTGLANGQYTLTPSKASMPFTPTKKDVVISGASVTGVNFMGTEAVATFAISGTVVNQEGHAIAGVSLALGGAASKTATTDASGRYSFTGLANGQYAVIPSLAGVPCTPTKRIVSISGANVAGQDFVGTQPGLGFSSSMNNKSFIPLIRKGSPGL